MRPCVFLSYSHRDTRILRSLLPYLETLQRQDLIAVWTDLQIRGGDRWREEIDLALYAASVAVLLISQDFLASEFIAREELPRILQRQQAGRLKVLPVFLRPSTVTSEAIRFQDEHGQGRSINLTELQGFGAPERTLQELKASERARQFIGLHDRIRELAVASGVEGRSAGSSPGTMTTKAVRFNTERSPNVIDLQRAIHQILAATDPSQPFSIPLVYDRLLASLKARVQAHYDNYEDDIRKAEFDPDQWEYDAIYSALRKARCILADLPEELGTFTSRLRHSPLAWGHVFISRACTRLVELRLTEIISGLSSYQLSSYEDLLFEDYAGLSSAYDHVAKVDGTPADKLVSYRMVRADFHADDIVIAPIDYGGRPGWLPDDITRTPYIPPTSFLTDYAFPQMVWRGTARDDWRFAGSYQDIFIKDARGHYV